MSFSNYLYFLSLIKELRSKNITEGKNFLRRNYSGLSGHLRERRYLLMTKRGPVEYVFSLKHYVVLFSIFIFGLISSSSIFMSFLINVLKDDLVSSAKATPIIIAEFIDYRALEVKRIEFKLKNFKTDFLEENNKFTFNKKRFYDPGRYAFFQNKYYQHITNNFKKFPSPIKEISIKSIENQRKKVFLSNTFLENEGLIFNPIELKVEIASIRQGLSSLIIPNYSIKNEGIELDNMELQKNPLLNFISWLKSPEIFENNKNLIINDVIESGAKFLSNEEIVNIKDKLKKEKKVKLDLSSRNNPINSFLTKKTLSISPVQMPPEAEAYRILSGFDSEILQFSDLLKLLSINLNDDLSNKIIQVLERRDLVAPDNPIFFKQLTDRVSITNDLRQALNFIPLKAPMDYYYVSSKYGMRKDPKTKKKRFHKGIDLAGTWHEDVLAPADGIIIFAGGNGGYGKMIKIKHDYGIITSYGHLQKILVKKGQRIKIGDRIGKMGSTGRSTGQHLHYEIIVNGKHVNPALFIREGKKLLTRNILQASSS